MIKSHKIINFVSYIMMSVTIYINLNKHNIRYSMLIGAYNIFSFEKTILDNIYFFLINDIPSLCILL